MVLQIREDIRRALEAAQYRIYNHSAVQICHWTKQAIRGKGVCYKEKFYGIDCHRCMQFSPVAVWCTQRCIYCWRPSEYMGELEISKEDVDPPEVIIPKLIELRKELLVGFYGNPNIDKKKLDEAMIPNHFAISLSGEPLLYPYIAEMVLYLRKLPQTKSIFIVTNGTLPERIEELVEKDALPTQLYVSVNAPNEELHNIICCPVIENAWKRQQRTLSMLKHLKTRTIIRLTMIKGLNMKEELIPDYADLIEKASPHFVEVKAYMYLGYSRRRLKPENSPTHEEIKEWTKKLLEHLDNFEIMDEQESSRIVVLRNTKRKIDRWIRSPVPAIP